ncbi:MAG: UpxY family transcription antiterminator [Syntrophobacteraceae bacterium]|jgi:transcription antitermination factor NusG
MNHTGRGEIVASTDQIAALHNGFAWYALYCQVNHERQVLKRLEQKEVSCFLPLMETWSKRRDRRKKIELPMFPGYVFVHVHLDAYLHLTVVKTPAVLCFIRNSEGPLPVPHHQIEGLQIMTNAALPLTIYSFLKEGESVKVVRGPLAGCVGILDRVDPKKGRLVVNLDIFRKCVSAELDIEDVEPSGKFATG